MSSTLNVIITDAGIAEVINAQHTGTAPVVLTQVGFGRGIYTPTASQTALHDEIKRVSTIAGGVVGDNIMHIQALDDGESAYAVYEIGVYTASGTLFAVYSQPMPILHKVANSSIMCVIDFVLSGVEPMAVTVGDTDYTLAPATTTNQGVVELATDQEAITGTDTERAITPANGTAAYVSLSKDQTVLGNKSFSGDIVLTNASVAGILSFKKSTSTSHLDIEDSTHSGLKAGSIWLKEGTSYYGGLEITRYSGYTQTSLFTDNGGRLLLAGGGSAATNSVNLTVDGQTGITISYNSLNSEYEINATAPLVINDGITGITPSWSSGDTEITIPVGGIVAIWYAPASGFTADYSVGQTLQIYANMKKNAYCKNGVMQEGAHYIPEGTYIVLMAFHADLGNETWGLIQRIS